MIATVVQGRLEIHDDDEKVLATFEPLDVEGLAKFFSEQNMVNIDCSSSVFQPEDEGLSDIDVIMWLENAFGLAWAWEGRDNPMDDAPELSEEDMQLTPQKLLQKLLDEE